MQKNGFVNRPLAFVFENVRGITSSRLPDGTTVPDEICKRMKKLGYNISSKLIRASDYGVPQNRHRFIMVGIRDDCKPFNFILLDEIVEKYDLPSCKTNSYDLLLGSILSDLSPELPNFYDCWEYSRSSQDMIEKIGVCQDGEEAFDKFRKKVPLDLISNSIKKGRSWKNISPTEMSPGLKKYSIIPKNIELQIFIEGSL